MPPGHCPLAPPVFMSAPLSGCGDVRSLAAGAATAAEDSATPPPKMTAPDIRTIAALVLTCLIAPPLFVDRDPGSAVLSGGPGKRYGDGGRWREFHPSGMRGPEASPVRR